MKKLSLLLVALAVAVSASAGVTLKADRTVNRNKIADIKTTKVVKQDLQKQTLNTVFDEPQGEVHYYLRNADCGALYASSGYIYAGTQSSAWSQRVEVVYGEDGKVYMKNLLYSTGGNFGDYWVEGQIDEQNPNQIIVPLGQSIYWSDQYQANVLLLWASSYVETDEEGAYLKFEVDERVTEVVYAIDGDTMYMVTTGDAPAEATEEDPYAPYCATGLTAVWEDDGSFGGGMEWDTQFTETEPVVAPEVITEIPEDWQVYTYLRNSGAMYQTIDWETFSYVWVVGQSDGKIKVAFDGEGNVYIQDPLYEYANGSWVKGTYDWMTGIITIPTGQYLSWYEGYDYGVQLVWGSSEVVDDSYLEFTVDQRTTEIQFMIDDDCLWLLGGEGDLEAEFPYYFNATGMMGIWSDDESVVTLEFPNGQNPFGTLQNLVPAVPADPTADEWYDCEDESGYSRFYFTLPTTDVDGNPLDMDYVSVIIYTDDDQMFTFDYDHYYYDIDEDMTEIPYWMLESGYDFYTDHIYFYRTNAEGYEPFFNHQIGIQVVYTVNGVANYSNIVYLEVFDDTKVNEINAGKTVANVRYFNVAGQEMAQPEGMTIQVTTYTDGTTSAVKVVK